MNIQKIRYKNAFTVIFDVDPVIYTYCSVKLVLQPLLENAISYGVSGMDDPGEIRVVARKQEEKIILSVVDNGFGMSEEEAELVLTDSSRIHKRGSGVIESEVDEGTAVSICMPAVPYTDENRKILEKGFMFGADEINNRGIQDK